MANRIESLSSPEGWAQVGDGGLLIPEEYANNSSLNSKNQELLGLKSKLDVNSLEMSILDAYTSACKQDVHGVDRYNKKISPEEASELISEKLFYHVHGRHFEGMLDVYEGLKQFSDPNGQGYLDVLMRAVTGIDSEGIKEIFEENPKISSGLIAGVANKIAGSYLQTQTVPVIQKMYKDDFSGMKESLINLGETFKLTEGDNAIFKVKDVKEGKLNEEQVFRSYLQSLFGSWQKIEQGPQKKD